jgi:hypothetical protein
LHEWYEARGVETALGRLDVRVFLVNNPDSDQFDALHETKEYELFKFLLFSRLSQLSTSMEKLHVSPKIAFAYCSHTWSVCPIVAFSDQKHQKIAFAYCSHTWSVCPIVAFSDQEMAACIIRQPTLSILVHSG